MEYTPISIHKREKMNNGKRYIYYEARSTVTLADGTSQRICGNGKKKKEAGNALMKKIELLLQEKPKEEPSTEENPASKQETSNEEKKTTVPVRSDTFNQALEHFLEYRLKENGRESTYVRDNRTRRNQIMPYPIAQKHPLQINHNDILEYIQQLKDAGCSKSTQDKAYSLVRLYYNYIFKDNQRDNPCYGVVIGYSPKLQREQVLSSKEVTKMFQMCDEIGGNADLYKFAFMTYERPGEVATLKFSDWNQETKTMRITRTYTENKNGQKVVSPDGQTKTRSSDRIIMLSDMANEIIRKRYDNYLKENRRPPENVYIWTRATDKTKPIEYNALRRMLKKLLKMAGVNKHVTPHGLRHSGITFYGQDRDQLMAISRNAGHSRPSITEDIYSHILEEHEEKAVCSANRLNERLYG